MREKTAHPLSQLCIYLCSFGGGSHLRENKFHWDDILERQAKSIECDKEPPLRFLFLFAFLYLTPLSCND